MHQPIDLSKYDYTEEDHRAYLKAQYETLVIQHTNIMYEALADPRLTEIELRLVKHPLCNIYMHFAILQRQIWLGALYYSVSDDPDLKRRMLITLRDDYRAVQRWPERWRDALLPLFAQWTQVLQREQCNGAG
jgi:hypothetical protein